MNDKFILDACCGSRMFWFNKNHPNTIFQDIRTEEKGFVISRDKREIKPDIIGDFRKMVFADKSFKLIVFDPPHLTAKGFDNSIMGKTYGTLDDINWRDDLKKGFDECWRVLEYYGVLIFKWNDNKIPFKEVLKCFNKEPLIGQKSMNKKGSATKWFCFMKIPKEDLGEKEK